ncbi:hypothetical protein R1flu_010201 [Riccia fluitans]|uniref:Protein SMG9 n=1 Tax=Riccia fluitans TaxID=41844 RepID=A0ABD1Z4C4_9MARC
MAGMGPSGTGVSGGGPKILLAKPTTPRPEGGSVGGAGVGGAVKLMRDRDEDIAARGRLPHGSLNLLLDSWDFYPDRLLPLMSDNTDFIVVGVLGPPGVGKSTILNELYGFDGTTTGVLPPFPVQTEEIKAAAKHCTGGIEMRVSSERIVLLDCQPVFSASVLMDLMRSDGFSNISVLGGDPLSAELAHDLMGLQLGVFLSSVCHVLLVVSEGVHDVRMWRLMQTVEMLKQGIPDPSALPAGQSTPFEKDDIETAFDEIPEFFSDVIFVHTKLRRQECTLPEISSLERAISLFFPSPSFRKNSLVKYRPPQSPSLRHSSASCELLEKGAPRGENGVISLSGRTSGNGKVQGGARAAGKEEEGKGAKGVDDGKVEGDINMFVLPLRVPDEITRNHHESYATMLAKFRNQILSLPRRPFNRPLTERDWLRNAGRMWDLVKKSRVLAEYSKVLQSSGLYRRWHIQKKGSFRIIGQDLEDKWFKGSELGGAASVQKRVGILVCGKRKFKHMLAQ